MASGPHSTVLVVDDEEAVRKYLSEILSLEGYSCQCFEDSQPALSYLKERQNPADLVLADIRMPGSNGIELLRSVKSTHPALPVILISGLYELGLAMDALDAGADDYLHKPVQPRDVLDLVGKHLRTSAKDAEKYLQDALGDFAAGGKDREPAPEKILQVLKKMGWQRYETLQHSKRVAAYSRMLGEACGLDEDELRRIELGALLHDIGKVGIPVNVLMKPQRLTPKDWEVLKTHPSIGHRLLAGLPHLEQEAQIVLCHHERFDGGGYPRGLRGEEIPLGARLFSIADAFDAITSNRPYRAAQDVRVAKREIARMSGKQFDPQLVEKFLAIPDRRLKEVMERYPDEPGGGRTAGLSDEKPVRLPV